MHSCSHSPKVKIDFSLLCESNSVDSILNEIMFKMKSAGLVEMVQMSFDEIATSLVKPNKFRV